MFNQIFQKNAFEYLYLHRFEFSFLTLFFLSSIFSIIRFILIDYQIAQDYAEYELLITQISKFLTSLKIEDFIAVFSLNVGRRFVYPFLVAVLVKLFPWIPILVCMMIISYASTIGTCYFSMKIINLQNFPTESKYIPLILFITNSAVITSMVRPYTDMTALLFSVVAIYFYCSLKFEFSLKKILLLYISFFLVLFTRESYIFLIFAFFIYPLKGISFSKRFMYFILPFVYILFYLIVFYGNIFDYLLQVFLIGLGIPYFIDDPFILIQALLSIYSKRYFNYPLSQYLWTIVFSILVISVYILSLWRHNKFNFFAFWSIIFGLCLTFLWLGGFEDRMWLPCVHGLSMCATLPKTENLKLYDLTFNYKLIFIVIVFLQLFVSIARISYNLL